MGYLGTKPQTATTLADNIVTTDKIAAGAVVEADIADGAVTTNKLSNSGVTAGTYGSASAIPAVTVDAKGRITSITTNAFSSTPTTAQVLSATAGAAVGDVGSYAFLRVDPIGGSNVFAGSTVAGSTLRYTNGPGEISGSNPTPSGTWRVMGYANNFNGNGQTLYLRIS